MTRERDHPAAERGASSPEAVARRHDHGGWVLAGVVLAGAAVSVVLGVYGRVHTPTGRAVTTLGLPTLLDMKIVLTSGTFALGVVQVLTALRMYGRLGRSAPTAAVVRLHRVAGLAAVVVSLPVAFHCLWALGFADHSTRVLVHSVAGCVLYGVFVAKMLSLRIRRVPTWSVPWLGGLLVTALVVVSLTSAGWGLVTGAPRY